MQHRWWSVVAIGILTKIDRYLQALGEITAGVRGAMAGSKMLRRLAELPLMSNLLPLTYEGQPAAMCWAKVGTSMLLPQTMRAIR